MRPVKAINRALVLFIVVLVAANPWLAAAQASAYPVTVIFLTSPPEPLCRGDSFTVLVNVIQPGTFARMV
jgi:hypothetical protein